MLYVPTGLGSILYHLVYIGPMMYAGARIGQILYYQPHIGPMLYHKPYLGPMLWKEALRVATALSKHYDDLPRETMIVTGCCKDLRAPVNVGSHDSGLIVTKDKQVAPYHFDQ